VAETKQTQEIGTEKSLLLLLNKVRA